MKRYTAGGMAIWLFMYAWISSWFFVLQPVRAYADPFTAITLQQTLNSAIAAQGGTAAAATQWDSVNVSQRSKAGLTTLLAKMGVSVHDSIAISSTQLKAMLSVSYNGMVAKGTWNAFAAACNSAVEYGGYLWATWDKTLGSVYDLFAIEQAASAPVAYTWPAVSSRCWVSESEKAGLAAARINSPLWQTQTATQLKICQWVQAALLAGNANGDVNHAAPIAVYREAGNTTVRAGGQYATIIATVLYHSWQGYTGWEIYTTQSDAVLQPIVDAGLAQGQGVGSGGTPAVLWEPDTGTAVGGYTTNPDVLPIPVDADVPAIDNPALEDIGAIDYPGTLDPVPWVPPLWIPKVPGLSLDGVSDWLQDILDGLANALPTDWSWLLSPFTGILGALQAIIEWLDGLISWLEAQIANIFSPSGEQLQLEFEPDWNNLKTKLSGKWPFALGALASLIIGSLWGGEMSGGQSMPVEYRLDLNIRPGYDWHIDVDLHDYVDPLTGMRWFWVVLVWVWLAIALWRLIRPVVTI